MDRHIHQMLDALMGARMASHDANIFTSKMEHTILLAFFHLIYFWKRFAEDIF